MIAGTKALEERQTESEGLARAGLGLAADIAAGQRVDDGHGLDIDADDVVVHFDPPEDPKAYLHRSGRTARAGSTGMVVTLVQWNQVLEVERIQTRIGLRMPIVEMFSNDPRLADLAGWVPEAS